MRVHTRNARALHRHRIVPELPEVENAARRLREAAVGRRIARVRVLHPALARALPPRDARALAGARITDVRRRGKHQLIHLDDGRVLHAHFRMSGDWLIGAASGKPARFARVVIDLDDGTCVALEDPRALSSLSLSAEEPDLGLGPEPDDAAFGGAYLTRALANRRSAIKPVLLDQRIVAGVGNIYASESLWRARLDPRRDAGALTTRELGALARAIRAVLERASGARYRAEGPDRFRVYDREGEPCRRCGAPIERIVQAGRSTYFCPRCQR